MAVVLDTTKLDELIGGGLHRRASGLVQYIALLILDLAQSFAPVRTGHLKGSLQKGGEENIFEITGGGLIAIIGTHVIYALFQEAGTRHMRAQPFLSPAVELARTEWVAGLRSIFGPGAQIIDLGRAA